MNHAMMQPMTQNTILPDNLLKERHQTRRQWKQQKRREVADLKKALDAYRLGCAYCPVSRQDIDTLVEIVSRMKAAHSMKSWGRD